MQSALTSETIKRRTTPLGPDHLGLLQERLARFTQRDLFFIGGCPKSGTSWLQFLLDAHPDVACQGESGLITHLLPFLLRFQADYSRLLRTKRATLDDHLPERSFSDTDTDTFFAGMFASLLEGWCGDSDARCLGEKAPESTQLAPFLNRVFPQAKFIHIIRDGRDVVVSGWFHNLRCGAPDFRSCFPTLADYVDLMVRDHWVPSITAARAFGDDHPSLYHEVRYENLHRDTDESLRGVLDFLGVDSTGEVIRSCRDAASFQALAAGRAPGDEDRGSFFRKGIVGDWQSHFDDDAARRFDRHGGELLRELGYPTLI